MALRDKIDGVLIDPDENGFHLILSGEDREYNFTLDQDAALALSTAVAVELSPWIREMQMASMRKPGRSSECGHDGWVAGCPVCKREEAAALAAMGAYEATDPKHPGYHDTMSEVWDSREGK